MRASHHQQKNKNPPETISDGFAPKALSAKRGHFAVYQKNTPNAAADHIPRPIASYLYFDKVQIWLPQPINAYRLRHIRQHCGCVHVENGCWFDDRYRQRLQVCQPARAVLEMFATLDNVLLNYVELACDLVFSDATSVQHCAAFFQEHFVQSWHRPSMRIAYYPEGGFTTRTTQRGERRNGRWFGWYIDEPCRITGEVDCFHFEGKYCGVRFLRRIGIEHARDLLDFDLNAYFAKHLTLYALDFQRLGRFHSNRESNSKRKRPDLVQLGRFTYNRDLRLGATLYRALAVQLVGDDCWPEWSLQRFVDEYGRGPFLTPIPPPHSYVHVHGVKSITSIRSEP